MIQLLFERSSDPIWLYNSKTGRFVDCNEAAVSLMRCGTKERLLNASPAELSPALQPNGKTSEEMAAEMTRLVEEKGGYRFEWVARRLDGTDVPLEIVSTNLGTEKSLHMVVSREISERRHAEARILQQTQELESRVRERTVELVQANEQLKAEVKARRQKEKIQRALYQITEAIHTTEDLESLYKQIHASIQGLMNARNFYIALHDHDSGIIHFPYFIDEVDKNPGPVKLTAGLTSYVLTTGKSLLARRSSTIRQIEPGVAAVVEDGKEFVYSETGVSAAVWLGAPLNNRKRTLGVMAVQNYQNESAYGEEEKSILSFIAEQTALAIERKRAEQALRESEAMHRALFEASSQAVMLHDENGFLEVNPATLRVLGYSSKDQILGKHPSETSAPMQAGGEPAEKLAPRYIQECLSKGSARFEWVCRTRQQQDIPVEVILTRIEMGGRQVIQAVMNDISERKKAEAELLKALEKERELSLLKSKFVSMVSHEFRTPLGIIMSSAEILEDYFDTLEPAERSSQLQSIHKNTRRMAELMEEVLLLGKFEAGKMPFHPAIVNLDEFCHAIIQELRTAADNQCEVHYESDAEVKTIFADKRLLHHVFTNLLSNAIKFSPASGRVRFTVRNEGRLALFEIADDGIGIPEKDLPHVFKGFHRGQNAAHVSGTGLGLAIVKHCVDLHGGEIRLESVQDKGTKVSVRLPHATKASGSA
ncbi:MAG TPA: ATP-binding protein [Candidatus Saccharimonadales bacterium]|nr:ATP-binding protein [Candidatus Saccharimonadales bacterium]